MEDRDFAIEVRAVKYTMTPRADREGKTQPQPTPSWNNTHLQC
jgi:hypothetical protein